MVGLVGGGDHVVGCVSRTGPSARVGMCMSCWPSMWRCAVVGEVGGTGFEGAGVSLGCVCLGGVGESIRGRCEDWRVGGDAKRCCILIVILVGVVGGCLCFLTGLWADAIGELVVDVFVRARHDPV